MARWRHEQGSSGAPPRLQRSHASAAQVAHERNLPNEEMKKVMGLKHFQLVLFVRRHQLNWSWLLSGDLEGLRKMVREKRQLS
jgi:hypothetical protein